MGKMILIAAWCFSYISYAQNQEKDNNSTAPISSNEQKLACKDAFISADEWQRMHKRAEKKRKFAEKLKNEGHTCVLEMHCYPPEIFWCNKYPCERANILHYWLRKMGKKRHK